MDGGRSWLGALALALATSAVVLVWYSGSSSKDDGLLGPESTQPRPLHSASTSRHVAFESLAESRSSLETRAAGRVGHGDDEDERRSGGLDREPETEAEYLAGLEALVHSDPERFDALLAERVGDETLPVAERVAIARVAWQARRPGWESAYRAGLATSDSGDVRFSRAVQNWLSRDAAAHVEAREFLRASLWGPSPSVATSRGRRALAGSLASAVSDAEWVSLEARLHGEADAEVVLSALIGRGRRESPEEAALLFERFGLDAPSDLHASEGD